MTRVSVDPFKLLVGMLPWVEDKRLREFVPWMHRYFNNLKRDTKHADDESDEVSSDESSASACTLPHQPSNESDYAEAFNALEKERQRVIDKFLRVEAPLPIHYPCSPAILLDTMFQLPNIETAYSDLTIEKAWHRLTARIRADWNLETRGPLRISMHSHDISCVDDTLILLTSEYFRMKFYSCTPPSGLDKESWSPSDDSFAYETVTEYELNAAHFRGPLLFLRPHQFLSIHFHGSPVPPVLFSQRVHSVQRPWRFISDDFQHFGYHYEKPYAENLGLLAPKNLRLQPEAGKVLPRDLFDPLSLNEQHNCTFLSRSPKSSLVPRDDPISEISTTEGSNYLYSKKPTYASSLADVQSGRESAFSVLPADSGSLELPCIPTLRSRHSGHHPQPPSHDYVAVFPELSAASRLTP